MPMISFNIAAGTQNGLVTHVPADVWRQIFKIHVDEEVSALLKDSEGSTPGPHALLFCQICSRWREIATSAPEIWNTISFYIYDTGRLWPHPQLLSLVLKRARSMPLTISLDGVMKRRKKFVAIRNAVRLLLKNFHRASYIDINTDVFISLPKLLDQSPLENLLPEGAPLLRNLVFRSGPDEFAIDPRMSRLWTLAPNLQSAVFHGSRAFNYPYLTHTLQFPFGQLKSINIVPIISGQNFRDLLSNSKHLIECIIGNLDWSMDNDLVYIEPIVLPALRHLSVNCFYWDDQSATFLVSLQTPVLTTLYLGDYCESWSHDGFLSFLSNSSCSIREFGFDIATAGNEMASEEKLKSLRFLSQLTSLTLGVDDDVYNDYSHDISEALIYELTEWDELKQEYAILPRLQKITVEYDFIPITKSRPIFANMVEDRRIAVKVVKVHEARENMLELLRLLVLRHSGYDVELDPEPKEAEAFYPRVHNLG